MLYNFNKDKLDKLLFDFYSLTGLATSVWDAGVNLLSFQPRDMCRFCSTVKTSAEGRYRCMLSDRAVCMECAKTGKPATHYCHAGLVDTAVPIKFKDSVMGYIIFGQVVDNAEKITDVKLKRLSEELELDYKELLSTYGELDTYDKKRIGSAAEIMKTVTAHLWLSDYIEIGYSAIASEIDNYIRANIKNEITVKGICHRFSVSKNKLYEIAHTWFKMTIGEYITFLRIEEAKKLLNTTDMSVREISTAVGINDYNYFTKVFKAKVGLAPLRYRKDYPFSIA